MTFGLLSIFLVLLAASALFYLMVRAPTTAPTQALTLEDAADLLDALKAAEADRAHLTERIEHLETIVAAEAWDALASGDPEPIRVELPEPEPAEPSDAEKVQRLARRMRRR